MSEFRVVWEIDVDAEDAYHAAQQALEIQLDPDSTAHVFAVRPFASGEAPPRGVLIDLCSDDFDELDVDVQDDLAGWFNQSLESISRFASNSACVIRLAIGASSVLVRSCQCLESVRCVAA